MRAHEVFMREWLSVIGVVASLAGCSPGVVSGQDGAMDSALHDSFSHDALPDRDDASTPADASDVVLSDATDAPPDAIVVPGCDPIAGNGVTISTSPAMPVAPNAMTIDVDGPSPWTYVDVSVRGPSGSLSPSWVGVTGSYRWEWMVASTSPGDYCITFTSDMGATVHQRLPVHIGGTAPSGLPILTRSGTELMSGATRFRFIGINSAGLVHYGTSVLPASSAAQIETQLTAAQNMGARVVRVFAAANDASSSTVASRLGPVLDAAERHGMYVIASLIDFYATPYHPQGDDGAYQSIGGYTILAPSWFTGGFRTNYLPWVHTVVSRYAGHHALFGWEIGNELKDVSNPDAFIAFAQEVSNAIRADDPNHLVVAGIISAESDAFTHAQAQTFYSLPNIDVITTHNYDGGGDDDSWIVPLVNKPMIIEEAGYSSGDRPTEVDGNIHTWVDGRGARGYMQWGFLATSSDNGDGDRSFGMDMLFHSDWSGLFATYQSNAARIR